MNSSKTHTLLVRGIEKSKKNSLKRIAKLKRQSVNALILSIVDEVTAPEIQMHRVVTEKK